MAARLLFAGRDLQDVAEDEPVTEKYDKRMNQAPNPTRRRAHVALLEVALNQLKNKGSTLDEVA